MMKRIFIVFILASLALTGVSCKRGAPPAKESQTIQTYKTSTREVTTHIEATGSVQPDLQGTSKILPYLAGTVQSIAVRPGDMVKKGDALVSVLCPEVTDTYSAYLGALAQLSQAERIYNLNTQLFEVGAVTKNDVLNSEATKRQLTAVADGLKTKLSLYGYATDGSGTARKLASDTVAIKAPMSGYVADIQTHVGDKVDPSTPLMTIADPKNIVIVANVYDTDVPRVRKGSQVTFYTDVAPNIPFKGIITYISDVSDQDSKTVKTFIKLTEGKNMFKQNMFLKLRIEGEKRLLPVIPQSAMIYKGGKFYVYCPNGGNDMKMCEIREIKPVTEVSGRFMAVEGLGEGQEVVVSAIDLEKP